MDLTEGYGQSFARYLLLAVTDLKQAASTPWNPIMISAFEDFIASKLLCRIRTTTQRHCNAPISRSRHAT